MKDDQSKKFVILEVIESGYQLHILNKPNKDFTKNENGKTIYKVLGYADTSEEMNNYITRRKG